MTPWKNIFSHFSAVQLILQNQKKSNISIPGEIVWIDIQRITTYTNYIPFHQKWYQDAHLIILLPIPILEQNYEYRTKAKKTQRSSYKQNKKKCNFWILQMLGW